MRQLSLDIETRPNEVYEWSLVGSRNGSLPNAMLIKPSEMLCFAAKWIGEDTEPIFKSTFHDGQDAMIDEAWTLLNEADVLVHYNGARFDEPKINVEFILSGYAPPAPYNRVDLYNTVKRKFAFPSGKLEYVAQALGIGEKVTHSGFDLWKRCMANDAEAWEEMKGYNIQDAILNEKLYAALKPWISALPSYGAELGEDVCPACGSTDLNREGFAYTRSGRYQRYRCDECQTWSRASRRDGGTGIVQTSA